MAGEAVNGAGDVNGDGCADVIVGAPGVGRQQGAGAGAAYVIFGGPSAAEVDLADLGARGFTIAGGVVPGIVGEAVSGAGDVNGDGLDDLVVGGGYVTSPCCHERTFVVFGKQDAGGVEAYSLGTGGFAVDGPPPSSGQDAQFGRCSTPWGT